MRAVDSAGSWLFHFITVLFVGVRVDSAVVRLPPPIVNRRNGTLLIGDFVLRLAIAIAAMLKYG